MFGEAVLEALKSYKEDEFKALDHQARAEAESVFGQTLDLHVLKDITFRKEKIALLVVEIKDGKCDRPQNQNNGKVTSFEVSVSGKKIALVICTEKTSEGSVLWGIWDGICGLFKSRKEINPSDIVYVKFWNFGDVEKKCIKKKITPLWIRRVESAGQSFFIVAINRNGSNVEKLMREGNEMDEEDIIKALTGIDNVSKAVLDLAAKTVAVDYGKEEDGTFNSKLPRCKNFLNCPNENSNHTKKFTHACKSGDRCRNYNPEHRKLFYHAKTSCKYGSGCTDESAEHRMMRHGEVKKLCKFNPCKVYGNPEHMGKCLHGPHPARFISFDGFATERGFIPDYDENMRMWINKTSSFLGVGDMRGNENFRQISDWLKHLQPVHQCTGMALASIVKVGVIASLARLRAMWATPSEIAHIVWLQKEGMKFLEKLRADHDESKYKTAKKYAKMYCRYRQADQSPKIVRTTPKSIISSSILIFCFLFTFLSTFFV